MSLETMIVVEGQMDDLEARSKHIIVTDLEEGHKVARDTGIVLARSINAVSKTGIIDNKSPRWCKLHSIGERAETGMCPNPPQQGQWVLIEFNRWTPPWVMEHDGIQTKCWSLDDDAVLGWAENEPPELHQTGNIGMSDRELANIYGGSAS